MSYVYMYDIVAIVLKKLCKVIFTTFIQPPINIAQRCPKVVCVFYVWIFHKNKTRLQQRCGEVATR